MLGLRTTQIGNGFVPAFSSIQAVVGWILVDLARVVVHRHEDAGLLLGAEGETLAPCGDAVAAGGWSASNGGHWKSMSVEHD